MLFLSPGFLAFFGVVFLLHWTVGRGSAMRQNAILLLAGLGFYGWLDLRFLALVLFSAGANMALGAAIERAQEERAQRAWLWTGVALNLGLLGYFKYFGFFHDAVVDLLNLAGGHHGHLLLKVLLPLGISYYTFQLTGYLLDVFNGSIPAYRKPVPFFAYVLHFPKLLAGPVEPIQHFVPRLDVARTFDPALASDALRQILWGLFAKLVIADNCALLVAPVFNHIGTSGGSTLLVAAMLYFLQVYGDFSGYSNMAIGFSKLLGLPLTVNFRTPLFATDVGDFWRRWHISLTTWMMDHVFTPLNFLLRGRGKQGLAASIFITFLAVGIWHGANWTFILFGVLQGIYFLPLVLRRGSVQANSSGKTGGVRRFLSMIGLFVLMALTFILMRTPTVHDAWAFWSGIPSRSLFELPRIQCIPLLLLLVFFIAVEWHGRSAEHALGASAMPRRSPLRWLWMAFIIFLIGMYMATGESTFIYLGF